MIPALDWEKTLEAICEQSRLMDEIHDNHPGKEHRLQREALLRSHREICVQIGYRRIDLLKAGKAPKINIQEAR